MSLRLGLTFKLACAYVTHGLSGRHDMWGRAGALAEQLVLGRHYSLGYKLEELDFEILTYGHG